MDWKNSAPGTYPGVKRTLSATLNIPGTSKALSCIPSTDFIHALIAFNKQITDMIYALDTKGKDDKIALAFELNFDPKGSTNAYLVNGENTPNGVVANDGENPGTFKVGCYCNGPG